MLFGTLWGVLCTNIVVIFQTLQEKFRGNENATEEGEYVLKNMEAVKKNDEIIMIWTG